MNPQDFKALLDSLNRIGEALEGKEGKVAVDIVNRFSVVFRSLKSLHKVLVEVNENKTAEIVLDIMKIHVKIAQGVLDENC